MRIWVDLSVDPVGTARGESFRYTPCSRKINLFYQSVSPELCRREDAENSLVHHFVPLQMPYELIESRKRFSQQHPELGISSCQRVFLMHRFLREVDRLFLEGCQDHHLHPSHLSQYHRSRRLHPLLCEQREDR